jgi:hypothetical protein
MVGVQISPRTRVTAVSVILFLTHPLGAYAAGHRLNFRALEPQWLQEIDKGRKCR